MKGKEMDKYVKLIYDQKMNAPTWVRGNELEFGQVYKVATEDSEFYRVYLPNGDRSNNCFKTRFVTVEKEIKMDKVIAVKNWKNQYGSITAGKTYDVTQKTTSGFFVKNDKGSVTHLDKSYFKEVVETSVVEASKPEVTTLNVKPEINHHWSYADTAYCINNTSATKHLTLGKAYSIIGICPGMLKIKDDQGMINRYDTLRFVSTNPVPVVPKTETYTLPDGMVLTGTHEQIQGYLDKLGLGVEGDGIHYVSSSKGLIKIRDMNTKHLINAFLKQYREYVANLSTLPLPDLKVAIRDGNGADKTFIAMLKELLSRME
jgi:hypothetical protein